MSLVDIIAAIAAGALVVFTIVHNVRKSLRGDPCSGCNGCGVKKKSCGGCIPKR